MTEQEALNRAEALERKATPVFRGFCMYFPRAMKYVSQISLVGNQQHHANEPLHWDMEKSTDEADCILRHQIDGGVDGSILDKDGFLHIGKVAWRGMAQLERKLIEMEKELREKE